MLSLDKLVLMHSANTTVCKSFSVDIYCGFLSSVTEECGGYLATFLPDIVLEFLSMLYRACTSESLAFENISAAGVKSD